MVVIGAVLFCSYAYFYEGGGWNQNTRFDLVRALVAHRSLVIDDYAGNTGDKSRIGEHVYIDKAPGASFTAVPAVSIVRSAMRARGERVDTVEAITTLSYVATIVASALPAMVGALALFWICRRILGASDDAAAIATLAYGLGTPMWAYAVVFYGHALCAGCLVVALAAACALRLSRSPRTDVLLSVIVGLAGGWATLTEYPALVPSALIAWFALQTVRAGGRLRALRVGSAVGVAAGMCAIVLLAYNRAAFGTTLTLSYAHFDDPVVMHSGFFDITGPRPSTLWPLLFGRFRGLLPLAPVLAIAPLGLWWIWTDGRMSRLGRLAIVSTAFALMLNLSYAKWEGGWNYGPRHMGWALPFLCLGLAPLWMRAGRWLRGLTLTLTGAGILSSILAVTTTVEPPANFANPLTELWWPAFRAGLLSLNRQTFLDLRPEGGPSALLHDGGTRAAWNLGQLMGLNGHLSLMPLLAVWVAGAVLWAFLSSDSDV